MQREGVWAGVGLWVASTAILGVLAISGCGGDDDDAEPAGGGRASHQAFVSEAVAICVDANAKEVELGAQGPGWVYGEQFDDPEYLADFIAVGRAALRELRALTPPEADAEPMQEVTDSVAMMVRALDGRLAALRAGRRGNIAAFTRPYLRGYGDLTSAAGPLGLTECQGLLL